MRKNVQLTVTRNGEKRFYCFQLFLLSLPVLIARPTFVAFGLILRREKMLIQVETRAKARMKCLGFTITGEVIALTAGLVLMTA